MAFIPKINVDHEERLNKARQDLLRKYAKYGGSLFGPIPKKHNRQFFCLDKYSWVWHEDWTDENNQLHSVTTRYEIRPNGVFKVQNGGSYVALSDRELQHLLSAAEIYTNKVYRDYQNSYAAVQ